jgi:hypothetical protein
MRNFALLKTPKRRKGWDNIEKSESNTAPSQPTGWNPGKGQWKMVTGNSTIQISQLSSNKTEKGTALKTKQY